eukprot:15365880-Ditylum_brightwellii.AAC.2
MLEGTLKSQGSPKESTSLTGGPKKNKNNKNGKQNDGPPAWHTRFKGQTITHNRKENIWCKECKCEGRYNGLCMLSLHDHTAWLDNIKKNMAKRKENV